MSFTSDSWDDYTRRAFMAYAAQSCLGVVACGGLFGRNQVLGADKSPSLPLRSR